MKAAVWHKKGDIRIEKIPHPSPGPGQVKVKIKVCGICSTDLHEFREGPFLIPSRPHPLTNREGGPVILGHEFSAEVTETGEGVTRFSPGDRVVVNPLIYCGECHYCRRGLHIMCTKLGTVGFAADGAFAEYGVFYEYALLGLPDSVTDEMGAFVEPLAAAVHAVNRSRIRIGDSVAVVGAGPIGLLVMQACRAAGASNVFVVEPMKARREIASETGAAAVIDPTQTDPGKEIGALTDGLRADLAFDCVGNQSSFDTAVRVTGRRAIICIVGLALKPIEIPFIRLWGHEKEITFSSGYEDEFPAAIAYLADRRVQTDRLISGSIKLDDLVEKGIQPLIQESEKHIKILVYP
ncbi:MAG: 2,3-butanediol dehydrogenase [Deltaproteobacteria bacterium]|nr:2,3-butanediol dehydrogenase [Deltaproteobacteria bacterium]